MVRLLVLISIVFVPQLSFAAVTISEVAWMGTTVSANDEWIELYNDGAAVDVTDWQLSDGMNFSITLSGSIPAESYAVLERTDDSSAPGSAFLVYTGALPNTGATLTLTRTDGSVVDQVAGGENWELIGGDNVTKETAQLTSAGWGTGAPTPGGANVHSGLEVVVEEHASVISQSSSGSGIVSARQLSSKNEVVEQPPELWVGITAPATTYVNQPITLQAERSGLAKGILQSLTYQWNFGDVTTATGSTQTHSYRYPGTYVVTLRAQYKKYEAEARQTITVLPKNLSLVKTISGDAQLHNDAKTEIDVSGFTVAGVTLPPRTIMVPNGTITIPHEQLAASVDYVVKDIAEAVVAVAAPTELQPIADSPVASVVRQSAVEQVPTSVPAPTFSFAPAAEAAKESTETSPESVVTAPIEPGAALVAQAAEEPLAPHPSSSLLYICIALLLGLIVGIYTRYL